MNFRNKPFAVLSFAAAALALAGCSSYTELARWNSSIPTNDGEVPIATFMTQNFSYQLFGFIPICTGLPWTEGNEEVVDDFNVSLFADEATLDNNIVSLRHAMDVAGSHRIAQLESSEDNSAMWSLLILKRHEVRTKCLILKPEPESRQ